MPQRLPGARHGRAKDSMNRISDDKMRHIAEVTMVMAETAESLGWPEEDAEDAALLGFVHDIGYLVKKDGHAEVGADILERSGYLFAKEVRNHGWLVADPTPRQALLWHADMSVDARGNRVSYDERLDDIRSRYGDDAVVTRRAEALVGWLKANFGKTRRPETSKVDDQGLARQATALATACPRCSETMRVESMWRDDGMLMLQQRCPACGHISEETFDAI